VARGEVGEAVAHVAGEVELEHLGEPQGLRHRLGVIAQAARHLVGRYQHRLAVAPPHLLRGIEGEPMAHGHQGVLQERPAGRVGVHVASGHHGHAHVAGQRLQRAGQRAVAAKPRALDLHPCAVRPEDAHQPPEHGLGLRAPAPRERRGHQPMARAPRQARESLVVRGQGVQRQQGITRPPIGRIARVRMGHGDEPAEVAVPPRIDGEEGQVPFLGALVTVTDRGGRHRELGSRYRTHSRCCRGVGELQRSAQAVVVGERQRGVAEIGRAVGHLRGQRRAVEEAERRVGVQLHVGRASHG